MGLVIGVWIPAGTSYVVLDNSKVQSVLINLDSNQVDWALNTDGSVASSHSTSTLAFLKVDNTGTTSSAIQIELNLPIFKGTKLYSMGQGSFVYLSM